MKYAHALSVILVIALNSCKDSQHTGSAADVKNFIEGIYARAFTGEYAYGHDTLVIKQPDAQVNYYVIEHRMSYQTIKDAKALPLAYKKENWTAIFNDRTNVLEEQRKGKQISFLPDQNALLIGSNEYKKLE